MKKLEAWSYTPVKNVIVIQYQRVTDRRMDGFIIHVASITRCKNHYMCDHLSSK